MTGSSNADGKPRLAFYRAAACGGCEIALAALGLEIGGLAAVEALDDGAIDVCLFNGALRDDEDERVARLLRGKSRTLVAFGACAHQGGILGLVNLCAADRPVKTLAQVVDVDYFVPGCPPAAEQVQNVFHALSGGQLPAKGAVIGADDKTNCDVCPRQKGQSGARVRAFQRPHLVEADPGLCFLSQGLLCSGPATRAGCGLPCIAANMPCRGCYGPPDGVQDQGAKLLSAVAALVDVDEPGELPSILDTVVDPAGTLFRFGLADSSLSELKYG